MLDLLVPALALVALVGGLAAHAAAGWRHRRDELAALAAFDLVLLVLLGVGTGSEPTWNAWMREDAWVEWATVLAFLAAAGIYVQAVRTGPLLERLFRVGLAAFCVFVAGEEISWGQRLLSFQPPEIFLEQNFQQELNVHNLLQNREAAGFSLDSKNLVALVAVVYGVLLAAARPLLPGRLRGLPGPLVLAPGFATVALAELSYPLDFTGEAAEWMLGLLFLWDGVLRGAPPAGLAVRGIGRGLALFAGTTLLAILTAPVLDRLLYGSDEARVALAREEAERLARDLGRPDADLDRLERKGRVHKRLFTAVRDGYLALPPDSAFLEGRPSPAEGDLPDARRDRQGYFLDPWNNAWWVLSDDGARLLVIYSFGPNRRRDVGTRPFEGFVGDDVGVVVAGP